jgi:hypothetical protein
MSEERLTAKPFTWDIFRGKVADCISLCISIPITASHTPFHPRSRSPPNGRIDLNPLKQTLAHTTGLPPQLRKHSLNRTVGLGRSPTRTRVPSHGIEKQTGPIRAYPTPSPGPSIPSVHPSEPPARITNWNPAPGISSSPTAVRGNTYVCRVPCPPSCSRALLRHRSGLPAGSFDLQRADSVSHVKLYIHMDTFNHACIAGDAGLGAGRGHGPAAKG